MNRRDMMKSSIAVSGGFAVAHIMSKITQAGKGWCRSDPIVRVDGVMYQITGFAQAKKAVFSYTINYRDTYECIMSLPTDIITLTSPFEFACYVTATDEEGNVVPAYVEIKEIGR